MTKKTELEGISSSCQMGEIAVIECAARDNGSFVAGLYAAAVANHERGLPGRLPA